MAILDKKVSEIYSGRDISSLSDRPNEDGLQAPDLKARFDQLGKEVIPNFNDLIDELNGILNGDASDIDALEGRMDNAELSRMFLTGSNSNIDVLSFFTETIVPFTKAGQLRWNEVLKTLELKISDNVTLQIGKETLLEAMNDGTTLISNGQAVYVSGGAGTNVYIKRASTANGDIAQSTIGVATEPMQAGHWGHTCTEGLVNGINTFVWEEGDKLYLGIDGALTNVEPISPTPKVFMGVVLRKHLTLGSIYVKVRAIPRMAKLSDVFVSSIADGHALIWNGTTGRFENEAIYNKTEVDAFVNARYTKTEVDAQFAETDQRIDNIVTTPVPVGEIIAQEIIDARDGEVSVGAKIRSVDAQLAQYATHLTKYGVKPSNTPTENNIALANAMLSTEKSFYMPKGHYKISETFKLKAGCTVIFHPEVTIEAVTNVNILEVANKVQTHGRPRLLSVLVGFDKAGLYINGDARITELYMPDGVDVKTNHTGHGVHVDCIRPNAFVYFAQVHNLYLQYNENGILLTGTPNVGYPNSNRFSGICNANRTNINMPNNGTDNVFNITTQADLAIDDRADVFCAGSRNLFNIVNMDVGNLTPLHTKKLVTFAKTSSFNIFHSTRAGLYPPMYIDDFGYKNTVGSKIPHSAMYGLPYSNYSYENTPMLGNQDDVLAFADKKYTVTTVGDAGLSTFPNVFRPNGDTALLVMRATGQPLVININLGSGIKIPRVLGLCFSSETRAKYVKFRMKSKATGVWHEKVFDENLNTQNDFLMWDLTYDSVDQLDTRFREVTDIEITISHKATVETLIYLSRIFCSASTQGNSYLTSGGGDIYGDLNLNGNKLIQPAFVVPTLSNSWVQDATSPLKYYKDTQGTVHVTGNCNGGVIGQVIVTLPVGFRPDNFTFRPCVKTTDNTLAVCTITTSGEIKISAPYTTGSFSINFSFRQVF